MNIYDADDLVLGGISPPPFLLSPWLRSNSLTLLSANPFTGKSALMMGIAASLRYQKPLLGAVPNAGRILVLALDAPRWDYLGLYSKILAGMNAAPSPQMDRTGAAGVSIVFDRMDLMSQPTILQQLLERCRPIGGSWPQAILIDTLRNIHMGDEDNSREMGVLMGHLRAISDQGPAILLAHHNAKSPALSGGYASRGSTVIPASADIHIALTAKRGESATAVRATWVKGRGGDCPTNLVYSMSWDSEALRFSVPQIIRGRAYAYNELGVIFRLPGDKLNLKLAEVGLKRGADGLWRKP